MLAPYSGITVNSVRRLLTANFTEAGMADPQADARALVGHALGLNGAGLIARGTEFLTSEQFEAVSDFAARRLSREPVSQILGYKEFWKDRFTVTPDVLTPRPETEGIIEAAMAAFADAPPQTLLDLGTGSGALILSLLREFPKARASAVDISAAALDVARGNAQNLGLTCAFVEGSWLEPVPGRFDLIVSNPPYITEAEMDGLDKDVRDFEPALALCGGVEGLDPYRIIANGLETHLAPGGVAIFEIGHAQGAAVSQILQQTALGTVSVAKDLAGLDRVVMFRRN